MNDNQNNKDLGLIDILQILGQWGVALVKKLTDWCLYLFFFGLNRWKIFVIVGLTAGVYSLVMHKIQDIQYEANMIVRSNAIEAIHMKKYFDAYSSLVRSTLLSDSVIEERTGLDSIQRSYLTSISTFYCVDEDRDGVVDKVDFGSNYRSSDPSIDSLNLSVKVRFEDVSILPLVAKSLSEYIASDPYILNCNSNRLTTLEQRKVFVAKEIQLLDTLQKRTYSGLDIANTLKAEGSNVMVDNRKVIVYWDKLSLLERAENVKRELDVYSSPITIVENFVITKEAINKLTSVVKSNVIFSLVGTYFILFAFFLYKREKDKYLN